VVASGLSIGGLLLQLDTPLLSQVVGPQLLYLRVGSGSEAYLPIVMYPILFPSDSEDENAHGSLSLLVHGSPPVYFT
jgi:hypothetical protein